MAVVINTNISSLKAQNSLRANNDKMAQAMERLSTGNRINGAKDDAAGMAIAERMTGKLNGFTVAIRNSNDAISMMQTAEGDMTQISMNLQRIRELAVQSNNTTNSDTDRVSMQVETDQLINEIQRIASGSSFNGISLLDGGFSNKSFQVGASNTVNDRISVSISDIRTTSLGQNWVAAHSERGATFTAGTVTAVSSAALAANDLRIAIGSGASVAIGASVADAASTTNYITADSAAAKAAAIQSQIDATDSLIANLSVDATTTVYGQTRTTNLRSFYQVDFDLSAQTAYDATAVGTSSLTIAGKAITNPTTSPDGESDGDAKNLAAKINSITGVGGTGSLTGDAVVTAQASTRLVGNTGTMDNAAAVNGTYYLRVGNSFSTEAYTWALADQITFVWDGNSPEELQTKLTQLAADITTKNTGTGIKAEYDSSYGRLILSSDTGENIKIEMYTSASGGTVTTNAADIASLNTLTGLTIVSGEQQKQGTVALTSVTQGSLVFTGGTAGAITSALNATAANGTNMFSLVVNGQTINMDASNSEYQSTLVADLNDLDGITATLNRATRQIDIVADDGRNVNIKFNNDSILRASDIGISNTSANGYETVTNRGKLTLTSSNGGISVVGSTGLTRTGLSGASNRNLEVRQVAGTYSGGSTLNQISISTQAGASSALSVLDNALDMVNQGRATSGAYQNRFLAAVNNLSTAYTNLSAARSQIMDTDYATESTTLAKSQIVAQAATAMLAQANQSQQSVLALLK